MIVLFMVVIMAIGLMMWGNVTPEAYTSFGFLTKPLLNDKDQVMFKTQNGLYLTVCKECENMGNVENRCKYTICLREEPYNSSVFTLHRHRDNYWSIESINEKFWKRCTKCMPGCDDVICADGVNKNLRTHKFHLIKNGDGTIKWRTDLGRFIESCPCNQSCGKIMCGKGLGGDVNLIVEKVKTVPPEPQELQFKPQWQNTSVPNGVLLSNVH